ncbi:hypothetical protein JTB14_010100 [Gonioctena quinquepunctata]|nr:hypothetical protein JTB14_010100 [Gonioctena quinquepunctata]
MKHVFNIIFHFTILCAYPRKDLRASALVNSRESAGCYAFTLVLNRKNRNHKLCWSHLLSNDIKKTLTKQGQNTTTNGVEPATRDQDPPTSESEPATSERIPTDNWLAGWLGNVCPPAYSSVQQPDVSKMMTSPSAANE